MGQVFKFKVADTIHRIHTPQGSKVAIEPDEKQNANEQQDQPLLATVLKIITQRLFFAQSGTTNEEES